MTEPVRASEVKSEPLKSQRRERRKTPSQVVRDALSDDPRLAEREMLRQAGQREVDRLRAITNGEA